MNLARREFVALAAAPLIARSRPVVAVTMDDVAWRRIPESHRAQAEERLLDAVAGAQAFLFAVGSNVDNPEGAAILSRWSAAGHRIGNHTYAHRGLLGSTTAEEFEADILRNEAVVSQYSGFRRWFRFPALKEGRTREIRDRVRRFLAKHGYRNGAVTIDASDWYYDVRFQAWLKANPRADVAPYRQAYLDHMWDRAQYYDQLSREAVGRSVRHTMLVHYNLLNSLFLADLLKLFRSKGWGVIGAEEAFADPVFRRAPDTAPAGESLIWAIAKETGRFEDRLVYPGEDDTHESAKLDRLGL